MQILCRHGAQTGLLPTVPFAAELLYAASTATLLHFGMYEPSSLTPSYYQFMLDVSGRR